MAWGSIRRMNSTTRGKTEELFQYNTKVSVPFIVSNKNYGVLWDSYSLCRFGDPRDYSQLGGVFKLYDKDGKEGALTGTYVPADKRVETIVRREDSLYFEHLDRAARLKKVINLPDGFPFMGAGVTYEGEIEPSETGLFRFILYYAGYTKVYINNELAVPERWRTAWNPNSYKFAVNLEAGKRVPLKIEWKPDGQVSYCGLRVLSPVADEEQNKLSWWGEMQNEINYYFVYGDNMDEVVSGYRTLTGKSPIMPKWQWVIGRVVKSTTRRGGALYLEGIPQTSDSHRQHRHRLVALEAGCVGKP